MSKKYLVISERKKLSNASGIKLMDPKDNSDEREDKLSINKCNEVKYKILLIAQIHNYTKK